MASIEACTSLADDAARDQLLDFIFAEAGFREDDGPIDTPFGGRCGGVRRAGGSSELRHRASTVGGYRHKDLSFHEMWIAGDLGRVVDGLKAAIVIVRETNPLFKVPLRDDLLDALFPSLLVRTWEQCLHIGLESDGGTEGHPELGF